MVVFIAAYHYFRIFNNWEAAYAINASGGYSPTGLPFNNAYRYVDWFLTVPLLVIELILILGLTRKVTSGLIAKLGLAAALMIVLGYIGETDPHEYDGVLAPRPVGHAEFDPVRVHSGGAAG